VAQTSPELAVQWAQNISDGDARASQLQSVASRWLSVDEPAARAWIMSSALPAEMKRSLLEQPVFPNPPASSPIAPVFQ
jgi:hypothetical protein